MNNETATADQQGLQSYQYIDQYSSYPVDAQGNGQTTNSSQYQPMLIFPQYLLDQNLDTKVGGSRGSWTAEEDNQLKNAISQLGTKKWHEIAKFVPTRTSKQCRERWLNCLDPNIKKGGFAPWEDNIIIEKQKEIGNHWSKIAKFLPGRSSGSIKNRWYSGLRSYHPNSQLPALTISQE